MVLSRIFGISFQEILPENQKFYIVKHGQLIHATTVSYSYQNIFSSCSEKIGDLPFNVRYNMFL